MFKREGFDLLTIVQVPLTALGGTVQVETRNYFSAEETVREHLPSDSQRQRFACKYRNLSSKQLVLFEELAKEVVCRSIDRIFLLTLMNCGIPVSSLVQTCKQPHLISGFLH